MALWKYASLHLDICKEDTGTQAKMGMDQGFAIPPVRAAHSFLVDRSTYRIKSQWEISTTMLSITSSVPSSDNSVLWSS